MSLPLYIIYRLLDLYSWILIIWIIVSWLVAFNVINTHQRFVAILMDILNRLTEPVLRPIRRYVPLVGGLDLSPLVLLLVIHFIQYGIVHHLA